MDTEIEYYSREIVRQLRRPGAAIRTKEWADQQLSDISRELGIVRRPNGYQDFVLDGILEERSKFRSTEDDLERLPYDELRDDPLCTCENSECPIKQGKIPLEIREADDFESGLREFRQRHPGDPVVLREIRDEWFDLVDRVRSTQRRVLSALSNNQIPGSPSDVDDVDQDDSDDEFEDEIDQELSA